MIVYVEFFFRRRPCFVDRKYLMERMSSCSLSLRYARTLMVMLVASSLAMLSTLGICIGRFLDQETETRRTVRATMGTPFRRV